MLSPRRHGWVWLEQGWTGETCDLAPVERWRGAGRPFVAARNEPDDPENLVRLGLALPDKRRIGVRVERRHIARIAPPVFLADAIISAPDEWRSPLETLDSACRAFGALPRVYGSLAWQHVSGERYLRAESDVDLLFCVTDRAVLDCLIACLAAAPDAPRLDGEIVFPDGSAAAWRELAGDASEIMVKRPNSVTLTPRATLLAQLTASC